MNLASIQEFVQIGLFLHKKPWLHLGIWWLNESIHKFEHFTLKDIDPLFIKPYSDIKKAQPFWGRAFLLL